jgi:acetyl-CoA C-acetyltransferase
MSVMAPGTADDALRQPVLVGIGTATQREADLHRALEPVDLMLRAVRLAGSDADGATGAARDAALRSVDWIAVPQGRWKYRDPAGEIRRAIGADGATTLLAAVGVLQQSLIGQACERIAAGDIRCALVAGGDTGFRIACARQAGTRAGERQQDGAPDILLAAEEELLHPAELAAGIRLPAPLYALAESAWRARHGLGVGHHRARLGSLYQRFSEIAARNPDAWRRQAVPAADIAGPSGRNPMLAFPYTRLHCSSWNVDQAAALLLCSAGHARALGIPEERWVHPLASTESNHMVALSARDDVGDCAGARVAGQAALRTAGLNVDRLRWLDLYSCFPVAVETFAEALGLDPFDAARDLTVTGGMPFAGGPFNNYVLQATCRMAALIRADPDTCGLVSSVSGILTKQGFGIWSGRPGARPFRSVDVSAKTAAASGRREVLDRYRGPATVVGSTVRHDAGQPPRALVLADTPAAARVLAWSESPELVERLQRDEFCGAAVAVADGRFTPA